MLLTVYIHNKNNYNYHFMLAAMLLWSIRVSLSY